MGKVDLRSAFGHSNVPPPGRGWKNTKRLRVPLRVSPGMYIFLGIVRLLLQNVNSTVLYHRRRVCHNHVDEVLDVFLVQPTRTMPFPYRVLTGQILRFVITSKELPHSTKLPRRLEINMYNRFADRYLLVCRPPESGMSNLTVKPRFPVTSLCAHPSVIIHPGFWRANHQSPCFET
jgi:hypothetical protein